MSFVSDIDKPSNVHVEDIERGEKASVQELDPEHHDYLMKRHGTVDLDPLPSSDPLDPLNWPDWKKNFQILLIALQTFSATFMAAGLTPAFQPMAEVYGISVPKASYFTSAQIAAFGVMPLLWVPLMNYYGRNPFLITSSLLCACLNIAGGFCKTFAQQMATRVLVGIFISTAFAAGASFVADLAFSHERGKKNGWWSLALVVGTPGGPFVCGFVQQHAGTKWVYFVFAILNFVQFILWLFADETVYFRHGPQPEQKGFFRFLGLKKNPGKPLALNVFWRPFKLVTNFNVCMAVIAASIAFCYANIVLVVELPQAMGILFELDAQQLSYQYIALIIGSVIGELLAGHLSDWWMKRCIAKRGGQRVIVDRLWISYNGFVCIVVGLIVWGVYLYKAEPGHWKISPLIGGAVAAAGNNIIATVLVAFAIDSAADKAPDVGLYLNFVRSIYGFLGPFYFPKMFDNLNFAGSAGLMSALVVVFGAGPMILVHIRGSRRA
ncbi:major facilitator superfamily domain-containing protein [Scheffersomyces amazonensis]|uniref:major facilitator superfamily domain-containing protein n=1 Tax=Scheffersomyces amazonensis TaxID=1078765 RepID=UPI00315C4C50